MTSQIGLFDPVAAQTAKDRGIREVLKHTHPGWRSTVVRTVMALADRGEPFTTDDVRYWTGDPPAGTHYNAMGAIISGLAKAGVIRQAGYAKSARVIGHGNLVRRWTGNR